MINSASSGESSTIKIFKVVAMPQDCHFRIWVVD
jgi:hypothetical protein